MTGTGSDFSIMVEEKKLIFKKFKKLRGIFRYI